MCRLARALGRLPLAGRLFGRLDCSRGAPSVLRRGMAALTGRDLSRSFGSGETKAYALKDVSVELRQGEVNLLMGPSGSGKSTLLAVLSGILRPDAGAVGALGRDVWRMSEDEMEQFRLHHCSYIFQGYNLFPALTAREQLEIVLRWGEGCSSREARHRADNVLGQLGLTNKAHLRPAQLSGGEKQRVAIGRALVKNPTFVFADEPTAALDWDNGRQVIDLLTQNARERNAMVLVVTHDPRLVPFADRVFELADGQMQNQTGTGSPRLHHHDAMDEPQNGLHNIANETSDPLPFRRQGPRLQLYVPQPAAMA